jgi:3'-phosphoadenosine 5'-phosphosulfate sulfotransferase (PAPS reductase)/FAD synthetase
MVSGKEPSSRPLSFWTENDILQYIQTYDVSYCSIYGNIVPVGGGLATTGAERTGCMFCGFGCHREKEPNRFQTMKETHPKIYDFCMKPIENGGLGMDEVLDYIGVPH